eukprot:CAMPEP_0113893492 /NCGR_PEP_ID=MMETSP0780_2-20120614/16122_1 /TAXON_ID=652834 /ORGANISM="Palpitomonas bilix" /LENGTH=410 /DNA_ID=CAMNT_0000883787 /DNA_START=165 /DNA_END=1397 /DNA_ORIENTATION=- /assembly_acc=CAM_ASM_000599
MNIKHQEVLPIFRWLMQYQVEKINGSGNLTFVPRLTDDSGGRGWNKSYRSLLEDDYMEFLNCYPEFKRIKNTDEIKRKKEQKRIAALIGKSTLKVWKQTTCEEGSHTHIVMLEQLCVTESTRRIVGALIDIHLLGLFRDSSIVAAAQEVSRTKQGALLPFVACNYFAPKHGNGGCINSSHCGYLHIGEGHGPARTFQKFRQYAGRKFGSVFYPGTYKVPQKKMYCLRKGTNSCDKEGGKCFICEDIDVLALQHNSRADLLSLPKHMITARIFYEHLNPNARDVMPRSTINSAKNEECIRVVSNDKVTVISTLVPLKHVEDCLSVRRIKSAFIRMEEQREKLLKKGDLSQKEKEALDILRVDGNVLNTAFFWLSQLYHFEICTVPDHHHAAKPVSICSFIHIKDSMAAIYF